MNLDIGLSPLSPQPRHRTLCVAKDVSVGAHACAQCTASALHHSEETIRSLAACTYLPPCRLLICPNLDQSRASRLTGKSRSAMLLNPQWQEGYAPSSKRHTLWASAAHTCSSDKSKKTLKRRHHRQTPCGTGIDEGGRTSVRDTSGPVN